MNQHIPIEQKRIRSREATTALHLEFIARAIRSWKEHVSPIVRYLTRAPIQRVQLIAAEHAIQFVDDLIPHHSGAEGALHQRIDLQVGGTHPTSFSHEAELGSSSLLLGPVKYYIETKEYEDKSHDRLGDGAQVIIPFVIMVVAHVLLTSP
jgi:hypothetical protein